MNLSDRILITGANGFIGNNLMRHYQAQGAQVIGVDLNSQGNNIFSGDIANPDSFSHLLEDCHTIIHTAALVSNAMTDADMWRVNVLATAKLIAAAERHGVKRFIQISSIVAYGNSAQGELDEQQPVHADGGSYVLTKLASEHAVLAAQARGSIELVIIRPGDVYGPGSRPWIILPLEAIAKNQFMLPARGQGFFRPIYIDDLVRGIVLATASESASGEIINLSCEGYITTKEFFSYHYQWLKKTGPLGVSTKTALVAAKLATKIAAFTGGVNEASTATVYQLATKSWFDINKAQKLLGWSPQISLQDGMQRSEAWAREQKLIK